MMESDTQNNTLSVETHVVDPRYCKPEDLFTFKGDTEPYKEYIEECAEYLRIFAAPVENDDGKPICFHCGEKIDAFAEVLGLGVAFRWGLAHGEGVCTGCGWPARGMHYPKGKDGKELFSLRNFFLAYHPDQVEQHTS